MIADYDEGPGFPVRTAEVHRDLSQKQKGALLTNWKRRDAGRAHPYCALCVCEQCERERGEA